MLSGMSAKRAQVVTPVITLSGSTGTPNESDSGSHSTAGGSVSWWFYPDGTVDRNNGSPALSQFQDGIEWHDGQDSPTGNYWIRGTDDGGSLVPDDGAALNTWHRILGSGEATRVFTLAPGAAGPGVKSGQLKIDIATDSSGTNIVATGYYSHTMTYV
jgi:hypothetical protein